MVWLVSACVVVWAGVFIVQFGVGRRDKARVARFLRRRVGVVARRAPVMVFPSSWALRAKGRKR